MLRRRLHYLEWAIALAIITLTIFVITAPLTVEPAMAIMTETNIAPGQTHCRSEQVLTDEAGHKWQVMLFTQVNSPQVASLNLRLSGLSSSLRIQPQKPLIINTSSDSYQAPDIFLGRSPLPTIGQYNLIKIVAKLPKVDLLLQIPLENGKFSRLHIPKSLVKEWQDVAAKNPGTYQKLPSGFQLVC